jgi:hypothetical protein
MKKCSWKSKKWSLVFDLNSLLLELFVNCSELNDKVSVENTPNSLMNVI